MIAFSGDWKSSRDAERVVNAIRDGYTLVAHPNTMKAFEEFDWINKCVSEFVREDTVYAIDLQRSRAQMLGLEEVTAEDVERARKANY